MQKNYSRWLITGGEGFIGTHIQKRLKDFRTFDKVDGWDVRDEEQLSNYIERYNPDIILSLASTAGINRVEKDPIGCIQTNILGVQNILKHKGTAKLVHFSTSEVYGEQADRNLETDTTNVGAAGSPRWTYQASKVCADHLIVNSDPNALIIRPFNVFGPEQVGHGAIADFRKWAKEGTDLKIYGDGTQVRAWCIVDDFVDAVFALIKNDCHGIYNVGNPTSPITIKKLAANVIKYSKSSSKTYHVPRRDVDVYYRVPNIRKLLKDTGWKPKRDFDEELRKLCS